MTNEQRQKEQQIKQVMEEISRECKAGTYDADDTYHRINNIMDVPSFVYAAATDRLIEEGVLHV